MEWSHKKIKAVEKRAKTSSASYFRRCQKPDEAIAVDDQARLFTAAYKSYGVGGVDHLVIGNFGEVNKEFKDFIASTAMLAGKTGEAANMTPAHWTDVGQSDAAKLLWKRFKVALGCMAVRAQNELLIKRLQFIRNSPEAATAVAKAPNTRIFLWIQKLHI